MSERPFHMGMSGWGLRFVGRFFAFGILMILNMNAMAGQDMQALVPGSAKVPRLESPPALPENTALFETVVDSLYIIGPGDVIFVGYGTKGVYAPVTPDGFVLIEDVPPIHVYGKTLAESKREIVAQASKFYKKGRIDVTLSKAKNFSVMIAGMVGRPGIYVLTSGSRLSDLIFLSGGFMNAHHVVRVKPKSGPEREYDLRLFYSQGELEQNPYLNQGDQVFAKRLDYEAEFVFIREDKNFRPVQVSSKDNLEEVIFRYDGFKNTREWTHVLVYDGERIVDSVSRKNADRYLVSKGKILELHTKKSQVFVSGDVAKPGPVDFNPNLTAMDYVYYAGVLPSAGNVEHIVVKNSDGSVKKVKSSGYIVQVGDHFHVSRSFRAISLEYVSVMLALASLAIGIGTFVTLSK